MPDDFLLERDGDHWEQELWPVVKKEFPNYEILWRRLVVPLTNRATGEVDRDDSRWKRLRDDLPAGLEAAVIAHYSAFYFAARATRAISGNPAVLIEDAIHLLDACCENTVAFYRLFRGIARASGLRDDFPAKQFPRGYPALFQSIDKYRNAVLRNPVLGRRVQDGRGHLP
jgi:hypothetical protein